MQLRALKTLHAASRNLHGERRELCRVVRAEGDPASAVFTSVPKDVLFLRKRTAELLRELAARAEKPMMSAVVNAQRWDQVDALHIVSPVLSLERRELEAAWRELRQGPGTTEAAIEALATLDTAFDLVRLVERRFATFVRLRLQTDENLIVDERPFLDVAAALKETAEAFA